MPRERGGLLLDERARGMRGEVLEDGAHRLPPVARRAVMLPARRARLGPDAGGRVKMLAGFARAGPAFSLGAEGWPAGQCLLGVEAQKVSRAPLLLKTLYCVTVRMPGPTQDATCAPEVAPDPMTDQDASTR